MRKIKVCVTFFEEPKLFLEVSEYLLSFVHSKNTYLAPFVCQAHCFRQWKYKSRDRLNSVKI